MKKIVKKNYKILIGIVIGIIVSTAVTYGAENILSGGDISYNNKTSGEETVQGAIDELYEKADSCTSKDPIKSNICEVVNGTGEDLGDEIKCGTESFYIIENTSYKMVLFAKYNLEVGYKVISISSFPGWSSTKITNPSGKQSSSCTTNTTAFNCEVNSDPFPPSHNITDSKGDGKYKEALENYENYLRNTLKIRTATVSMVDWKILNKMGCFNISCSTYASIIGSCNKPWIYNQGYQVLVNSNNNTCSVDWVPAPVSLTTKGNIINTTGYTLNSLDNSYYGGLRAVVEITK